MKIDAFIQMCRNYLAVDVFPEYRFHETREWRFDYAIPSKKNCSGD